MLTRLRRARALCVASPFAVSLCVSVLLTSFPLAPSPSDLALRLSPRPALCSSAVLLCPLSSVASPSAPLLSPRQHLVMSASQAEKPCTLLLSYDSPLSKESEFMERLEHKDEDIKVRSTQRTENRERRHGEQGEGMHSEGRRRL